MPRRAGTLDLAQCGENRDCAPWVREVSVSVPPERQPDRINTDHATGLVARHVHLRSASIPANSTPVLACTPPVAMSSASVVGRAIAAVWVSGTAIGVYSLGAGVGSIGVSSVGLLDAQSGWLVESGARRIARAARAGVTEDLLKAGALGKLATVAAQNQHEKARTAAAGALNELLADERARTNALADSHFIGMLSRCADCADARKRLGIAQAS